MLYVQRCAQAARLIALACLIGALVLVAVSHSVTTSEPAVTGAVTPSSTGSPGPAGPEPNHARR